MVDEKKNENVNQENAGKINNYGLIELINFLNRFKTISSNQSNDKVQIRAMGHIVWKDQPKKKSMETAKNMNVNDSKDVEEKIKEKLNDINSNRNKMELKYGVLDDSYKLIRDDRDRQ